MRVNIDKRALQYVNSLQEKDRRIIKQHLLALEDPYTVGCRGFTERALSDAHRPFVYRVFDVLPGGIVTILDVMTIEEAHKRYKRFGR